MQFRTKRHNYTRLPEELGGRDQNYVGLCRGCNSTFQHDNRGPAGRGCPPACKEDAVRLSPLRRDKADVIAAARGGATI
ncbi:unnamed protein product [Gadus morhua 'NCC']